MTILIAGSTAKQLSSRAFAAGKCAESFVRAEALAMLKPHEGHVLRPLRGLGDAFPIGVNCVTCDVSFYIEIVIKKAAR